MSTPGKEILTQNDTYLAVEGQLMAWIYFFHQVLINFKQINSEKYFGKMDQAVSWSFTHGYYFWWFIHGIWSITM